MIKSIKSFLKKFWKLYWKDNSLFSYLFFILFTYLAFNYLFYPLFLFIFNLTNVSAIMTSSMEHSGFEQEYFFDYFTNLNYSTEEINKFAFNDGLNIGDVIFVRKQEEYKIGDIVVFTSPYFQSTLVHRLVNVSPAITKGDNNPESYVFDKNINKIYGKVIFKIPFLGLPRFWLYSLLHI